MLYYGKFRSIDTKQDDKGQEYKVEIFTNYDGTHNPYPFSQYIIGAEIPTEGIELTLASSPFVVEYENDTENIYKGYKCSTATVSFLMSQFNPEFFSNNDNTILVSLLKWNNNIEYYANEGNPYYINTENGNRLYQRKVRQVIGGVSTVVWTGFFPSDIDKFCYNVEWIGFATPNAYNQSYNLSSEVFELECQDALSFLQYYKVQIQDNFEIESITVLVNKILNLLGTYKYVYFPTTIRLPQINYNCSFSNIITQLNRFFDYEENEADDYLTVLGEVGKLVNCSIIPFKDSVYFIQYDGVYNQCNYYWKFYNVDLGSSEFYFDYYKDITTPHNFNSELVNLESVVELDKSSFAASNTNISIPTVYKNYSLTTNEKASGNLFYPTSEEYETNKHIAKKEYRIGASHYLINYKLADFNNDSNVEVTSYRKDTVNGILSTQVVPNESSLENNISVHLTDFSYLTPDYKVVATNKSVINFNMPTSDSCRDTSDYTIVQGLKYQKVPMMTFKTPNFIGWYNDDLFISGDWVFYEYIYFINHSAGIGDYTVADIDKFIWMKVKCCGKYLYFNNGYQWTNTEQWCKVYLSSSSNKAFGNTWQMKWEGQDFGDLNTGIHTHLANLFTADEVSYETKYKIMNVEITFARPFWYGKKPDVEYYWYSRTATLNNFAVELKPNARYYSYRDVKDNVEFELKAADKKAEDKIIDANSLTSTNYENNMYSACFECYDDHYFYPLRDIYNICTGVIAKPEQHIILNTANQYRNVNVVLETTLHYDLDIKPYSLVKWGQFNNKKFIVDNYKVDFEYNTNILQLVEKQPNNNMPSVTDIKYRLEDEEQYEQGGTFYIDTEESAETNHIIGNCIGFGIYYEGNMLFGPSFADGDINGMFYKPDMVDNFTARIENNKLIIEKIE